MRKTWKKLVAMAVTASMVICGGAMGVSAATEEEPEKVTEICTNLCKKFTDDETYVEYELEHFGSQVLCLELEPEHITGKLVNES